MTTEGAGSRASISSSRLSGVACGAGLAAGLGVVAGVLILRAVNPGLEPEGRNWWLVVQLILGCAYLPIGLWLSFRRTAGALGPLLALIGASQLAQAAATEFVAYARFRGDEVVGVHAATFVAVHAGLIGLGLLAAVVPLVLPVGIVANRCWLAVVVVALVCVAGAAARSAGDVSAVAVGSQVAQYGVAVIGAGGVALAVARWRAHLADREALPMLWLALGVGLAWLGCIPVITGDLSAHVPGHGVIFPLLQLASVPLVLVTILVLAVRHEVGVVDVASHRFLEWVLLCVGVVLIYTCLVAGLGELVGGSGPTWLLVASTGVVALMIEPAHRSVRRIVDRVVYGTRDDPLVLVRDVMQHVTSTTDVDALLPALAETVARSMRFDYVGIDVMLDGSAMRAASYGDTPGQSVDLPLRHGGEIVGTLTVGWSTGSSLRRRDWGTLDDVAAHLSVAVSWVRMTSDLRRANIAVASSREEERRRIRRDLHDGIGPALTGISLGIRTAIRQLERGHPLPNATAPTELLHRVADEVDNSLVDVKRIVRDLRPTALDDQTLTAALTEFARRFDGIVDIHLELPEPVALPAALEIAAYRIATEALTNVIRHSHARNCWVRLVTGGPVVLDVTDDGVGFATPTREGIGLAAMKERAHELGGAFAVWPHHPHGTHVHVALPQGVG